MALSFEESKKKFQSEQAVSAARMNAMVMPMSLDADDEAFAVVADSASETFMSSSKYLQYASYKDENYSVVDALKNITVDDTQINITQEQNSQFIPFEMPRYYDGVDLMEMTIQFHYVNKDGEQIIDFKFDRAKSFSEGLAPICINDKWGYVNTSGEIVIEPIFDYACEFNDGLARFNIGSNALTRGMSIPKGGLWGFLNKEGKIKILPTLKSVSDFENGYAQIIDGDNNNYIDKNGEILIKLG